MQPCKTQAKNEQKVGSISNGLNSNLVIIKLTTIELSKEYALHNAENKGSNNEQKNITKKASIDCVTIVRNSQVWLYIHTLLFVKHQHYKVINLVLNTRDLAKDTWKNI